MAKVVKVPTLFVDLAFWLGFVLIVVLFAWTVYSDDRDWLADYEARQQLGQEETVLVMAGPPPESVIRAEWADSGNHPLVCVFEVCAVGGWGGLAVCSDNPPLVVTSELSTGCVIEPVCFSPVGGSQTLSGYEEVDCKSIDLELTVLPAKVFSDGFETGDLSAWATSTG